MKRTLLSLATALEGLGENESAQLVRVLTHTDEILMTTAGPRTRTVEMGYKSNTPYAQSVRRQEEDTKKPAPANSKKEIPKTDPNTTSKEELNNPFQVKPMTKLKWLLPSPMFLKDLNSFKRYTRGRMIALNKESEYDHIMVSFSELSQMLREQGPLMAQIITTNWKEAYQNRDKNEMWRLQQWWNALGRAWDMIQDLKIDVEDWYKEYQRRTALSKKTQPETKSKTK